MNAASLIIVLLFVIISVAAWFIGYYGGLLLNAVEKLNDDDVYANKFTVYSNTGELLFHGNLLTAERIHKLTGGSVLRQASNEFPLF